MSTSLYKRMISIHSVPLPFILLTAGISVGLVATFWLGDLGSSHPRDTRLVTALFPQNGIDPTPVRRAGFLFHPGGYPGGTRSRTCCADGADSSLGS